MATDEKKTENRLRLTNNILISLSASTWNTLGESAFAFSGPMGNVLLSLMEREMGLEVTGESPEEVLVEIGRIFSDEFGFCDNVDVVSNGDNKIKVKVKRCVNRSFTDQLLAAGVEKPFICPVMNTCQAALRQLDYKMREDIEKWPEGQGSIITFTHI